MVQYKTCNIHHVLYENKIIPIKKYRKRCMECLHINVEAHNKSFQIVKPEYNYLYPMICGMLKLIITTLSGLLEKNS